MTVEIVPYDPFWPQIFEKESAYLKESLGTSCLQVYHVGSTSIPGLMAKPIIDIIAAVKSKEGIIPKLKEAGYISRGELNIPGRLYFKKSTPMEIHLHVYEEGHGEIDLNLTFRNYLRTHPEAIAEYEALKRELISKPESHEKKGKHFTGYTLGKNAFIKNVLQKAGFKGLTVHQVTHVEEWNTYHRIRREQNFEPLKRVYDEHHPSMFAENSYNFILYKGTTIVSVILIEFLNDREAAIRSLATDGPMQRRGYGKYLVQFIEKWIKEQGCSIIHVHANLKAEGFYRALGYIEMPFDDVPTIQEVIDLGKILS